MKLWLDDIREAPAGWTWVKTVEEAKVHLLAGDVDDASFDHDLGSPACPQACWGDQGLTCDRHCTCVCHKTYPTGTDLINWMASERIWPRESLACHSSNPLGRRHVLSTARRYAPRWVKVIGWGVEGGWRAEEPEQPKEASVVDDRDWDGRQ